MHHYATILLVEGDHRQASFLSSVLRELGSVDQLDSASGAIEGMAARPYDLALVNLDLPGSDGLAVVRALRETSARTGILVLTSSDTSAEKARAFTAGADDLVFKPFAVPELRARARRLLGPLAQQPTEVCSGSISVDPLRRRVTTAGKAVRLTRIEFDLLWHLIRRRGEIATRVDLLGEVWGLNINPGSNVIDRHLSFVRKKLGAEASAQIETVRGVGYRLHPRAPG